MYERVRAAPRVPNDFLYESANYISLEYDVIVVVVSTSDVNKSKQHSSNIPRSTNFFLSFDVVFFSFKQKIQMMYTFLTIMLSPLVKSEIYSFFRIFRRNDFVLKLLKLCSLQY